MKKFTCLLVALLALSSTLAGVCPTAVADWEANTFLQRLTSDQASTVVLEAGKLDGAGTCGVTGAGTFCCVIANFKTAISEELTKVKTELTNFGSKVKDFAGAWKKVASLLTDANIDSLSAAERSNVDVAILKAYKGLTPQNVDAGFTAFKTQVPDCFGAYAQAIRKVACEACKAPATTWSNGAFTAAAIPITQAGCDHVVSKCNRVWGFVHKFGWLVQITAAINKKKAGTASFTAPASFAEVYAPGIGSIAAADINTAVTNCDVATLGTDCTTANKGNLCKAFMSIWPGKAATTVRVGRSQSAWLTADHAATGTARRILAAATPTTGAIDISAAAGAVDVSTDAAVDLAAQAVTLASTDASAWTVGIPADVLSSSSSSSSSASSSKSAKVLIGSILSILAVALLN